MRAKIKSHTGRKIGRQKELNIIYFIDASSTRSIRIPIQYAVAILAMFVAIVFWAFGSAGIIYSFYAEAINKDQRINGLSAAVFDYQTRFDGVYESAYPEQKPQETSPASVVEVATQTPSAEPIVKLAAKPLDIPGSEDKPEQATPTANVMPASLKSVEIDLTTAKIRQTPGRITLEMDIKNKVPEALASGFVYAVVKLQSAGATKYVPNPRYLSLNESGLAKNVTRATSFTIRRFKPVQMDFAVPAIDAGSPISITAYIASSNAELYSFPLPVNQLTTAGNDAARPQLIDSRPVDEISQGSDKNGQ